MRSCRKSDELSAEWLAVLLVLADGVKLLPRRPIEVDVWYGYVPQRSFAGTVEDLIGRLQTIVREVHCCRWPDEVVLLIFTSAHQPCAIRITSSACMRYELYASPRPCSAQSIWQWAQTTKQ